ncbi:MAG: ribosome recycling factor [Ilumatobacter sp.]
MVIRINFPALTEERRRDYVKVAKNMAEDGRVGRRAGVGRPVAVSHRRAICRWRPRLGCCWWRSSSGCSPIARGRRWSWWR